MQTILHGGRVREKLCPESEEWDLSADWKEAFAYPASSRRNDPANFPPNKTRHFGERNKFGMTVWKEALFVISEVKEFCEGK